MRTAPRALALAFAAALAVGACGGGAGGSSSTPTPPANPDLTVHAEEIKFDKKAYDATSGQVKVDYVNKGRLVHDLVIFDQAHKAIGKTLRVSPGQQTSGTYNLPPGTYTMICDIPGHEEAGMIATLTSK